MYFLTITYVYSVECFRLNIILSKIFSQILIIFLSADKFAIEAFASYIICYFNSDVATFKWVH